MFVVDHDTIILLSTPFPTIPMLGKHCCCGVIVFYVGNVGNKRCCTALYLPMQMYILYCILNPLAGRATFLSPRAYISRVQRQYCRLAIACLLAWIILAQLSVNVQLNMSLQLVNGLTNILMSTAMLFDLDRRKSQTKSGMQMSTNIPSAPVRLVKKNSCLMSGMCCRCRMVV